jgi:hypothetical protein
VIHPTSRATPKKPGKEYTLMKSSTMVGALVEVVRPIGHGLVLLILLAQFVALGAGMGCSHSAQELSGCQLAGTSGDMHIGAATASFVDACPDFRRRISSLT